MKERKVVITLEVITNQPIKDLREVENWEQGCYIWGQPDCHLEVVQVQANVIKGDK